MLKKYSIIILLLCAYTIVLAHSIIPHHHHADHHPEGQFSQHDNHDDHHNNEENKGLEHDFGNYLHSGSTGDFHQQTEIKISFASVVTLNTISLLDFTIKAYESPPIIVRPFNDHIPIQLHCLSSKGLRAPPCPLA